MAGLRYFTYYLNENNRKVFYHESRYVTVSNSHSHKQSYIQIQVTLTTIFHLFTNQKIKKIRYREFMTDHITFSDILTAHIELFQNSSPRSYS